MHKHIFLCMFSLWGCTLFAQVSFEKGYIVDSLGQQSLCWIKNKDMISTPRNLEYRLAENSPILRGSFGSIREFGIDGGPKFVSRQVKVDRSSDDLTSLTLQKEPIFVSERLFLEVLTDGSIDLLKYRENDQTRFFYQTGDSVYQLIYKRYKNEKDLILLNNGFLKQLVQDVGCGTNPTGKVMGLQYDELSLVAYFKDYYACKNETFTAYTRPKKKFAFHVSLTPGVDFTSMSVTSPSITQDYLLPDRVGFHAGILLEAPLPFNKNKWSILVEPTYQSFSGTTETATVNYRSIEIPVGVRYYMYLANKSKLFVNAAFIFDRPFPNDINLTKDKIIIPVQSSRNASVGIGYMRGRLSGEFRYYANRNMTTGVGVWATEYNKLSFILGYRLV